MPEFRPKTREKTSIWGEIRQKSELSKSGGRIHDCSVEVSKYAQAGRTASPAKAEERKAYCSKLFAHQTSWNGLKSYLTAAIINVCYRAQH